MLRLLCTALVAFALSSCASYDYYGDERYYDDGYYDEYAAQPYAGPASGGSGYGYSGSVYEYPYWADYPAYYSLFWGLNRSWVDPYWHPHFYYGVTWFPRNYYDVSYRYYGGYSGYHGYWGSHYGYLSYSPYRSSWSDYYYDWYPWYSRYPSYHHYYAPRYGNARNEAERLARLTGAERSRGRYYDDGLPGAGYNQRADRGGRLGTGYNDVDRRRDSVRGADYYGDGRSNRRADPGAGGFGSTRGNGDYRDPRGADRGNVRGNDGRIDPRVDGFNQPRSDRAADPRGASGTRYGNERVDPRVGGFNPPRNDGRLDPRTGGNTPPRNDRVDPRVGGFNPPRVEREDSRSTPRQDPRDERDRGSGRAPARDDEGIPYPYNSRTRAVGTPPSGAATRYPSRQPDQGIAVPGYRSPGSRAEPAEPRYSRERVPPTYTPEYSAPRQPTRYEAPARQSQPTYSAPRPEPRYNAPAREQSPRYSAPAREESPRYSAPAREPSYSRPERESTGRSPVFNERPQREEPRESRDDDSGRGSARGESGRLRDD